MFGIVNFGTFVVAAFLLNITPGTDVMYILGKTIGGGRRTGMVSALGICSGILVHTSLAAIGLSVVLQQSALAFHGVKVLGAGYLIWMGVQAIRTSKEVSVVATKAEGSMKKVYLQGVLTNTLNPKVALFFLAFMPQFIAPQNEYGALPFLLLGVTFFCTSIVWCTCIAFGAGTVSTIFTQKQGVSQKLTKISGVIYIALGLNLLAAKLNV